MVVKKKDNLLIFFIMVGIPCAGKSTWIKENTNKLAQKYNCPVIIISRDTIREDMSPTGKYIYSAANEQEVTRRYYRQLQHALNVERAVVILDNTHVKEQRINSYFAMFKAMMDKGAVKVYVKFFDIPLWKAKWRNFWRNRATGKDIPTSVMNNMYSNYKRLDKSKYKNYEFKDETLEMATG